MNTYLGLGAQGEKKGARNSERRAGDVLRPIHVCMYIYIYMYTYIYIYVHIYTYIRTKILDFRGSVSGRIILAGMILVGRLGVYGEFKDVVFEDVVSESNNCATLLCIVVIVTSM